MMASAKGQETHKNKDEQFHLATISLISLQSLQIENQEYLISLEKIDFTLRDAKHKWKWRKQKTKNR